MYLGLFSDVEVLETGRCATVSELTRDLNTVAFRGWSVRSVRNESPQVGMPTCHLLFQAWTLLSRRVELRSLRDPLPRLEHLVARVSTNGTNCLAEVVDSTQVLPYYVWASLRPCPQQAESCSCPLPGGSTLCLLLLDNSECLLPSGATSPQPWPPPPPFCCLHCSEPTGRWQG